MSNGVEFEEDKYGLGGQMNAQQRFVPGQSGGTSASSSKMARWLINKGIVKSDSGAQIMLIVIVIINIIVTFFVIKYFI